MKTPILGELAKVMVEVWVLYKNYTVVFMRSTNFTVSGMFSHRGFMAVNKRCA